jgi:hypothetical protein
MSRFLGKVLSSNVVGPQNTLNKTLALSTQSKTWLGVKRFVRKFYPGYFNFRYLNFIGGPTGYGPIFSYAFSSFKHVESPLLFEDSKIQELFETAEKARYLAASLVSVDCAELVTIDSFRENYPFTSAYAKIQKMIVNKDRYLEGTSGFYRDEIENSFRKLENYTQAYDACLLMASFAEEIKLFIQRLYNLPKINRFKRTLNKVFIKYLT